MQDLGENPVATMLYAIWDLVKWWVVIALTWGVGLYLGLWIGYICLEFLGRGVYIAGISCFSVILGIGVTIAALCLPMAIESRGLAIGAAITNFTVWMLIGACISLDFG